MNENFKDVKKVYVIGIKGSGVIGVVEILHLMGIEIVGSDTSEKFFTDSILKRLGIKYFESFSKDNVPADADFVIYSTAYNENNNVEMKEVKKRGLPMVSYPEILAYLFNEKWGIAICGTHGKTTTSAMLANTLKEVGADPSAIIGSKVSNWDGNALAGEGEYFVVEADEYQDKLKLYDPKAVILTSCDFDHPDFFENFESYKEVFKRFVARIPKSGFLTVWGDSVDTLEIADSTFCDVIVYGFGEECDYRISNSSNYLISNLPANEAGENSNTEASVPNETQEPRNHNLGNSQYFEVMYKGKSLGEFQIKLVGRHNILNATAVIAVCHRLQLDLEKVRAVLKNFLGTSRRFEFIGQRNGAILIDDYAHHPDEIQPTLRAAREIYPEKTIWAVFHPHTYTRTKALMSEFSQSFDSVDHVIVLDIYGSAREVQGGAHSRDLVELINKYNHGKAEYVPTIKEAIEYLKDKIGEQDVVIAIGAGNGWEVVEELSEPLIIA